LLDEVKRADSAHDAEACTPGARALRFAELGPDVVVILLTLAGEDSASVFPRCDYSVCRQLAAASFPSISRKPGSVAMPRAWWRSVSSSFHALPLSVLSMNWRTRAQCDSCEFRLRSLCPGQNTDRLRAVLQLAAEKSGWGTKPPEGYGRGIACNVFDDSCIAHVAEVSVENGGTLRVRRYRKTGPTFARFTNRLRIAAAISTICLLGLSLLLLQGPTEESPR